MRYVALLRGINVSGHHRVPMAELKKLLEKNGYTNATTLLASGNVVFDTSDSDPKKLSATLEALLSDHFGFRVPTIVRPHTDIIALVKKNPFKKITVEPSTRLYVTFLSKPQKPSFSIPFYTDDGSTSIIEATPTHVSTVLELSEGTGTTDYMSIIEEEFGKEVTTRNWNTIVKIAAL